MRASEVGHRSHGGVIHATLGMEERTIVVGLTLYNLLFRHLIAIIPYL